VSPIRWLEPVVAPRPDKPLRPGRGENQARMTALAQGHASWDEAQALEMAATFDELASEWNGERGWYRQEPVHDALRRGGPFPSGVCIEVGSGTGILTGLLTRQWPQVVCVDLSAGMLAQSPFDNRLRADASRLPLANKAAAALVIADAPLFSGEVRRVLRPDGVVLWSNALGTDAPFYVTPDVVLESLERATSAPWTAVGSAAGWGQWLVLRRT
jgi:SAM-dependent methyltransferase